MRKSFNSKDCFIEDNQSSSIRKIITETKSSAIIFKTIAKCSRAARFCWLRAAG